MSAYSRAIAASAILATGVTLSVASRGVPDRARSLAAAAAPMGLGPGAPDPPWAGALTFGPEGVLLVGDSRGAAVYALSIDDRTPDPHRGDVSIHNIEK